MLKYAFCKGWYLPSNGVLCVCTSWTWLAFSRSQIWNINISKTVNAIAETCYINFTEVDIRHRMVPCVCCTSWLDLHFQRLNISLLCVCSKLCIQWKISHDSHAPRREFAFVHLLPSADVTRLNCWYIDRMTWRYDVGEDKQIDAFILFTLKRNDIVQIHFNYSYKLRIFFTLLDSHIVRWKIQKKSGAFIKLRKKEIVEDGWGILEFYHVLQWEWIYILT